ncbi:MAG TPA: aspartate/glutamate racemase family protein [Stellaceae bacterium]|nr:aspartate/glutamate racemase family protein [Stellaceae bacterium]
MPDTLESRSWEAMPCTPDNGPARTAAIGLVTLANDVVIERELGTFLAPVEGAAVFASRIPLMLELTPQTLRDMEAHIPRAVELIVPDDRLDVMAFGCTSGSMAIGPARVAAAVHRSRPGIPVTDPVSAALKGLKALGARRIALLTPYPDAVNDVVAAYVGAQGFEIAERASFKQPNDPAVARVPPEAIYRAGLELGRRAVDALFISCTALRCSSVIERIEQAIGKPVVASNQALAWDCLRLAGCRASIEGYGRLLRE